MVEKENRPLNQSGDLNWVQKKDQKVLTLLQELLSLRTSATLNHL